MEDLEIISMLNRRDEAAVTALLDKYGGLCRSISTHILRDERDIEENVNGVVMRLWSSIPPAQPQNLAAYVAKTARNEALMRLRKDRSAAKSTVFLPLEEIESVFTSLNTAAESAEAGELTLAVNRFLKTVSAEKRHVFLRRYWFFDSIGEIAENLGISESKVKSILFRMRNELRKFLVKEELL